MEIALWPQIEKMVSEQLTLAQQGLGKDGWDLLFEEGQMRLYSREMIIDGIVCDPLKAVTIVKGVTGYEVCHRFFNPDIRYDWESTLESMKILEKINDDTIIFHQIHKRVWPAAQRDAVFWSHIRKVKEPSASCLSSQDVSPQNCKNLKLFDVWIVCNKSTDLIGIPLDQCVRVKLSVSMVSETYINVDADPNNLTRDDMTCKIIYSATINPGGWAPVVMLRQVYKREFVKFLASFSQYVINSTKDKPIVFGP